jgi:hypothetical protein
MNPQDQAPIASAVPVKSQELIGPGELISSSVTFFKKNWKILVGIPATLFICGGVAVLLMVLCAVSGLFPLIIIFSIIYFAVVIVGGLTVYSAMINAIHRLSTETNPSLTILGQFKFGLKLFWPFLLLMIIVGLVTYGSLALFVIPGIIIAVYTSSSLFTFIVDGKRGFGALLESYSLIKGRWWATFGRIALLGLLCFGIVFASELLIALVAAILSAMFPSVVASIISVLLLFVVEIIMISFAMIYAYKLYINLKNTRLPNVSTSSMKPWIIASLILGIIVALVYVFVVIPLFITGFSQLSQSNLQARQQNSTTTPPSFPQQY